VAAAFGPAPRADKQVEAREQRIAFLETKLKKKDEVLARGVRRPKLKWLHHICKCSREQRLLVRFWYGPGKPRVGTPASSRCTSTSCSGGNPRSMAVLPFGQPFRTISKLFSYSVLGFLWAAVTTVDAAVSKERVLAISCLFTNGWYAWQDSNLRPVAPEAALSLSTVSVSPIFSIIFPLSGVLLSLGS
jgi:hypothetical protein